MRIDEGLGVGQAPLHLADPKKVLVIAQAAAAVFDIGLLKKRRVADLLMAVALVADAPGQIFLFMAVETFPLEGFLELGEERIVAGEKARLEQRGLGAQVAVGLGDDFVHRAGGVPDLKADVPEHVEHVLDDVVDLGRELAAVVGVEKEDVDVAVGIEFAAAEAAHGEQGDARRFLQVRAQMGFPRAVPEMAQHDGDDVGALFAEVASAFAVVVFELEPVLFQLQEAAVNIEQIGRP